MYMKDVIPIRYEGEPNIFTLSEPEVLLEQGVYLPSDCIIKRSFTFNWYYKPKILPFYYKEHFRLKNRITKIDGFTVIAFWNEGTETIKGIDINPHNKIVISCVDKDDYPDSYYSARYTVQVG